MQALISVLFSTTKEHFKELSLKREQYQIFSSSTFATAKTTFKDRNCDIACNRPCVFLYSWRQRQCRYCVRVIIFQRAPHVPCIHHAYWASSRYIPQFFPACRQWVSRCKYCLPGLTEHIWHCPLSSPGTAYMFCALLHMWTQWHSMKGQEGRTIKTLRRPV